MRNLMLIVFALVLLLAPPTCFGQASKRPKGKATKKTSAQPKPEGEIQVPSVTVEAGTGVKVPDEARNVGEVGVRYYRDLDETQVSAAFEVYRKPPYMLSLIYEFNVKGREVVRPEAVKLTVAANEFVLRENVGVTIEADGERFDFKPNSAGCAESKCMNSSAYVDFATFEKIANSRKVLIRAAPFSFELDEYGLGAARDLVRAVESTTVKP